MAAGRVPDADTVDRVTRALEASGVGPAVTAAEIAVLAVSDVLRDLAQNWHSSTVMDVASWLDGTL